VAEALTSTSKRKSSTKLPPKGALNEARWSEILQVAEDVFREKGYRATTVQEIASRVGIMAGSLYYYIENKQDLLYHVLARTSDDYLRTLREVSGISEGHAASRLSHFIDRFMAELDRDPPWSGITDYDTVFLEADQLASLKARRHKINVLLKSIITTGMAEGAFDPAVDPSVATNAILCLMTSTVTWYLPSGRSSSREITEWYKAFILKGLMPGASDPFGLPPGT
jgi:TetR/AcrR family transcriptional regulator, cholesterol catabolism regulator